MDFLTDLSPYNSNVPEDQPRHGCLPPGRASRTASSGCRPGRGSAGWLPPVAAGPPRSAGVGHAVGLLAGSGHGNVAEMKLVAELGRSDPARDGASASRQDLTKEQQGKLRRTNGRTRRRARTTTGIGRAAGGKMSSGASSAQGVRLVW